MQLVLQKVMKRKILDFDYLLATFVPLLRKAGVTDEQIRTLLEENPQRVLTVDASAEQKLKNVLRRKSYLLWISKSKKTIKYVKE